MRRSCVHCISHYHAQESFVVSLNLLVSLVKSASDEILVRFAEYPKERLHS